MAESHEHHAKDAKNEEKKDDKKEEKKDMKKLIKKEVQTHGEPVHEHKHGEPAHEHEHKPVEAVKKIEAPAPKKPVAAPSGRTAKDLADEIDKELSAGQFKAVEGDKGAKGAEKATGPTEVPAPGSRHPVPDRKAEPEVEIIEEEPETKKEEKGDKAEEGPKESTKEEAKEKKKGKKGGKLKGRKKKKKEYRAQPKPEISADVIKAMQLRRVLKDKTPNFIRQEAYNYGRLGQNWRKPRGKHSKLRHHISYRINVASIGYGGPNAAKGLHPSGFREVLVHHPLDLDGVDPKKEAARVAHGVGKNKRRMIQMRAERMGIRILNEIDTS